MHNYTLMHTRAHALLRVQPPLHTNMPRQTCAYLTLQDPHASHARALACMPRHVSASLGRKCTCATSACPRSCTCTHHAYNHMRFRVYTPLHMHMPGLQITPCVFQQDALAAHACASACRPLHVCARRGRNTCTRATSAGPRTCTCMQSCTHTHTHAHTTFGCLRVRTPMHSHIRGCGHVPCVFQQDARASRVEPAQPLTHAHAHMHTCLQLTHALA